MREEGEREGERRGRERENEGGERGRTEGEREGERRGREGERRIRGYSVAMTIQWQAYHMITNVSDYVTQNVREGGWGIAL